VYIGGLLVAENTRYALGNLFSAKDTGADPVGLYLYRVGTTYNILVQNNLFYCLQYYTFSSYPYDVIGVFGLPITTQNPVSLVNGNITVTYVIDATPVYYYCYTSYASVSGVVGKIAVPLVTSYQYRGIQVRATSTSSVAITLI
jgi:hypothetical protein